MLERTGRHERGQRLLQGLHAVAAAADEESGFTLVELLIVIAILGILAGVVVFSVAGVQDNSQTAACKTEASTVKGAEGAYYAKNKAYASAVQLTTAPDKLLNSVSTGGPFWT